MVSGTVFWTHNDASLTSDVFPRRECACTTQCAGTATFVPSLANTVSSAQTPCFIEEVSEDVREFYDLDLMVFGSRCFDRYMPFDLTLAAKCLTPGDEYSLAPARGGAHPDRVLFLVGDSHAAMLLPAFASALKGEPLSVALASVGNGAGFQGAFPNPAPAECGEDCDRITERATESGSNTWVTAVRAILDDQVQAGDIVAVVTAEPKFPHVDYISAQQALLAEMATSLSAKGATLLLVADTPNIKAPGRRCIFADSFDECIMPRSTAAWYQLNTPREDGLELHVAVNEMLASLAAEHSAVEHIDSAWVWDKMCDAQTCGPAVPGTRTVAWLDLQHLSTAGALYLGPFLNCWLHEKGLL